MKGYIGVVKRIPVFIFIFYRLNDALSALYSTLLEIHSGVTVHSADDEVQSAGTKACLRVHPEFTVAYLCSNIKLRFNCITV